MGEGGKKDSMKNTTKALVLLILSFLLVLTACADQPAATPQAAESTSVAPEGVVAEGRLEPIHAANLSFQARGVVEEINVKIGDAVKAGDVLARLSNSDVAMAQLAAANLELVQAQQALDTLNRTGNINLAAAWEAHQNAQIARALAQEQWDDINPTNVQNRVDDQQATVNDRKQDVNDAQDEFDKYKDLDRDNAKRKDAENKLRAAQKEYNTALAELENIQREGDSVRAALDSALAAEAEAKYQFEQSAEGPNQDQLTLLTSRLDYAKAQVAAGEDTLGNYQIIAPFDGVVAEVAIQVGEQVSAESRAISIVDTSSWIIETTDVTELEVVSMEVGQNVTFTADALSDVSMTGVVSEISQSSYTQGGDVIYTVRIQTDDVDPRVKWGMTVEVVFEPLE